MDPPTPEINRNKNRKNTADDRTYQRTDRQTCYNATQGIWQRGLRQQALRAIIGRSLWSPKSDADNQKERKRDREIERQRDRKKDEETEKRTNRWQTHNLDWTPMVSSRPKWRNNAIFLKRSFLNRKQYVCRNISSVLWLWDHFSTTDFHKYFSYWAFFYFTSSIVVFKDSYSTNLNILGTDSRNWPYFCRNM